MATACIVLLYVSYSIPVVCLLMRGRAKSLTGPFNLGIVGLFSNVVLLAWTLFTIVMYSFPYSKPIKAGNFNYVSVVYAVVVWIVCVDWFWRARNDYRGQDNNKCDPDDAFQGDVISGRDRDDGRPL